jgi:Tol biopolymer transport system component
MDSDGANRVILDSGITDLGPPLQSAVNPSWSPDGKRIVFVRDTVFSNSSDDSGLFTMDADGSNIATVVPYGTFINGTGINRVIVVA